jgi:NADP-dependent 3-hydroxy acid dehydrogenase YdfG
MLTRRPEIAVIVGAGSGLSASLARLFSREGMRVAIAARNTANLGALSGETGAQSFACDAVDPGQVARLFEDVDSRLGVPDVVAYNASARLRGSLIELVPAEVEHALRVSAFGGPSGAKEIIDGYQRRAVASGRGAKWRTQAELLVGSKAVAIAVEQSTWHIDKQEC